MKAKKAKALAEQVATQVLMEFMAAQPKPRPVKPRVPKSTAPDPKPIKVPIGALAWSQRKQAATPVNPFVVAQHPPGVVPSGAEMATDDACSWAGNAWSAGGSLFAEGQAFLGYPELSILAQRPEYRRISEQIAMHMTRKWIKLQSAGDEDKTEKLKQLDDELKRLKVRAVFRKVAEQDGFMGRGHIYFDTGQTRDPEELKTPIGNGRDKISKTKVGKGDLKGIRSIEAIWCYPTNYNSSDPLSSDWYRPSMWYVNARQIHASRLLTLVGREVPDMLKPAYSFGGLSLSQMAKPYVDNWLRTRQSVSDLLHSFSVSGIKTDLLTLMQTGSALEDRAKFFNGTRDNRGLMLLDKNTEEFFNVSTPLGTLDALQAQAQEQMGAVSGIPLVFLLGISPHGLNASSDGEIRAFYDWVHAYQEMLFTDHLTRVIGFAQLNLWGEVDPDITFEYEPLWSLDEKAEAEVRKLEAETDDILVNGCNAISPEEVRTRVAGDPDTPYAGLDPDDVPEPPAEGEGGNINLRGTEPFGTERDEAA